MRFLIFSDESGRWNEGEYYVRSWIKITPEDYNLLRKEVIFSKHEMGVKELKWERFKKNYTGFKNIFDVNFDVFLTISKPKHFQSRKYNILDAIEGVKISTGSEAVTKRIKDKIISSAKNELFFNFFEKTHIQNSKDSLLPGVDAEDYIYIIDTPQHIDRGWENIANECDIKNIKIEKTSENTPGIELADVIGGCVSEFLAKDADAEMIYKECIKDRMLNMTSRTSPNPNLIFYNDFSDTEKKELDIFR